MSIALKYRSYDMQGTFLWPLIGRDMLGAEFLASSDATALEPLRLQHMVPASQRGSGAFVELV